MTTDVKIEVTPDIFYSLIDNLGKHFRCDARIEYDKEAYPIYARDESYRTNQVGIDVRQHFYVIISPLPDI